ncbi:MAG: CPBP family intramembrane metalloprotease [bacterium]|nr:CPBP family intramembrane metalloprotease [bacterium]
MSEKADNRIKSWFRDLLTETGYKSSDNFYYLTLLSAPVLLSIYRYFFMADNFTQYFSAPGNAAPGEVQTYILEFAAFFILVAALPFVLIIGSRKKSLFKGLFSFENFKPHVGKTLLALVFIFAPLAYNSSTLPAVQAEYPLPRILLEDQSLLSVYFLALFFLYYVGWEFFFRGLLLFGLKDRYGAPAAILIQTVSSCLIHLGKPSAETLGSIPFGIVFGIIALRTKSLWPVIILHAALGILNDLFIIY